MKFSEMVRETTDSDVLLTMYIDSHLNLIMLRSCHAITSLQEAQEKLASAIVLRKWEPRKVMPHTATTKDHNKV